eukprot:907372_1
MSSSENEITIVYFENEMEDTIHLDDDTTLRLISNEMRCAIHDTMNSDYDIYHLVKSVIISEDFMERSRENTWHAQYETRGMRRTLSRVD